MKLAIGELKRLVPVKTAGLLNMKLKMRPARTAREDANLFTPSHVFSKPSQPARLSSTYHTERVWLRSHISCTHLARPCHGGGGGKGIAPVGIYIINIKSYMYAAVSIFIVVITIVYEFNAIGVLDIRHFIV